MRILGTPKIFQYSKLGATACFVWSVPSDREHENDVESGEKLRDYVDGVGGGGALY